MELVIRWSVFCDLASAPFNGVLEVSPWACSAWVRCRFEEDAPRRVVGGRDA